MQIGHNVVIGRHCVLVAQSGVSGSTVIGDFAALGGQAGLAGHLTIGPGAQIAAQAGVMDDVPAGGDGAARPPSRCAISSAKWRRCASWRGRRRQETRSRLIVWNSAPPQGGASAPAKLDGGPGTGHGPSPARKESDMEGGRADD